MVATHLKNVSQIKLDHFPKDRGENKKYLKPPPSKDLKSSNARCSMVLAYLPTKLWVVLGVDVGKHTIH